MAEKSITISFYSEAGMAEEFQSLVVELDAEMNEDKSQFRYGEKAYFKIFKYPASMVVEIIQSDGTITSEGSGISEETETITFVNTNTSNISKPLKSIVSSEWLGKSLGSISSLGTVITASRSGVGVLKITYQSNFARHAISVSEKEEEIYPVIVFVIGG